MQSVIAVLSGPVVYGVICLPVNWLIVKMFPSHFDEKWITRDTGILVLLVSLTIVFAGVSGFVSAWIAPGNVMVHAAAMCALQLAIGVAVQRHYWSVLPLSYHFSFFGLLIVGIPLGAWACCRLLSL
jgi:hypothetical protein